jgi:pimeloyl-ACP methyl ester carboxylesterase
MTATRLALGRFVVREVLAHALHGALNALPARAPTRGGPTVLLLHGHGGRAGGFLLLRRALARAGYSRFAAFTYGARGDTDHHVGRLARFVAEQAPDRELLCLSDVGHVGMLFAPSVHALVVERLARAAVRAY